MQFISIRKELLKLYNCVQIICLDRIVIIE